MSGTAPKKRIKRVDEFALQANYGYGQGWEDLTTETTRAEIRKRMSEYRENLPGTPYRIVHRRVPA